MSHILLPYSPVPWPSISTGTGKLVPDNRPREIFKHEGYLQGKVWGSLQGRSTHAVQSITRVYYCIY